MKNLHSIKIPIVAAMLSFLIPGTIQAYTSNCSITSFFPSLPFVQNQSCSLSIGVQYYNTPDGWSGTINWGDGITDSAGGYTYGVYNHTYTTPGSYTISCSGTAYEHYYGGFLNNTLFSGANTISASTGITVLAAPPSLTLQPTNQIVFPGSNAVFITAVASSVAVSLQWLKNGTNLLNATNTSLIITNVQVANEGIYSLFATNSGGTNLSSSAALVVRRPLKVVFNGFPSPTTLRLKIVNTDNSAIDPLRVPAISVLTKTNLSPAVNWQPLGISPVLNTGVLQVDSPVLSSVQHYYRAVETQ